MTFKCFNLTGRSQTKTFGVSCPSRLTVSRLNTVWTERLLLGLLLLFVPPAERRDGADGFFLLFLIYCVFVEECVSPPFVVLKRLLCRSAAVSVTSNPGKTKKQEESRTDVCISVTLPSQLCRHSSRWLFYLVLAPRLHPPLRISVRFWDVVGEMLLFLFLFSGLLF